MNLWIRTQDKKALICCNKNIWCDSYELNTKWYLIKHYDKTLGNYSTPERCQQILTYICNMMDGLACNAVYEMPEE